jgi:hypothetical protein
MTAGKASSSGVQQVRAKHKLHLSFTHTNHDDPQRLFAFNVGHLVFSDISSCDLTCCLTGALLFSVDTRGDVVVLPVADDRGQGKFVGSPGTHTTQATPHTHAHAHTQRKLHSQNHDSQIKKAVRKFT